MRKYLNKIILVLMLLLSLSCLFACNKTKEPTNMEKILACNVVDCKSATVETIISIGETELYKETAVYTLEDGVYNKTVDSETLVGLNEKTDGKNHSEEKAVAIYSLELKEEYFTDVTNDGVVLNAKLSETGTKTLIAETASNATIVVKTNNEKIIQIDIDYNMNGQIINIVAKYQY